jgi:4'-phosphopantetheinyl transferase
MRARVEGHVLAWCGPHQHPPLGPRTVHVWRALLGRAASAAQGLRHVLTTDEIRRADGYRFARDRAHFIASRALLRLLLGRYLDMDPPELRLVYGPSGKPELPPSRRPHRLHFNVSRSDDVALYAFVLDRQVGVDVERIRPAVAAETVAEELFSSGEVAALRALPTALQADAFSESWTRKEAYVKATGRGLSCGLRGLDDLDRWSVCVLDPAPGYAAALVAEGRDWQVERYDATSLME